MLVSPEKRPENVKGMMKLDHEVNDVASIGTWPCASKAPLAPGRILPCLCAKGSGPRSGFHSEVQPKLHLWLSVPEGLRVPHGVHNGLANAGCHLSTAI